MRDIDLYRTLLDIEPPWGIRQVTMDESKQTVTVDVELRPGATLVCPQCKQTSCCVYDLRPRTWRHLDTCQFKTLIHSPQPRIQCPDCGVKTAEVPWAQKHSRFTLMFEQLAIQALLEMSVKGACKLLRISWDEADGIMARAVVRGLANRDLSGLKRIGIDEKAVRRGHQYITVVYDLETSAVIWMGQDRTEATLDRFFSGLPGGSPGAN